MYSNDLAPCTCNHENCLNGRLLRIFRDWQSDLFIMLILPKILITGKLLDLTIKMLSWRRSTESKDPVANGRQRPEQRCRSMPTYSGHTSTIAPSLLPVRHDSATLALQNQRLPAKAQDANKFTSSAHMWSAGRA